MKSTGQPAKQIYKLFVETDIEMKPGMSGAEIIKAESFYNIKFPPDLKEIFEIGLPVSKGFYDWTDYSSENIALIHEMLAWPTEGILFDVKNNNFWLKEWGQKPDDSKIEAVVRYKMSQVPQLIPVFNHRYISSIPNERGNPVYSVYQTDIIVYGRNVVRYFAF